MDRRDAVKSVAFLIGGALSATTIATLFDSCTQPGKNSENLFTEDQEKLVTEIADIILPTTAKSPGAKAAAVGPFITMMIKDCYPEEAQKAFVKGLEALEESAKKDYSKSFLEIGVKEREILLRKVREATISSQKKESEEIAEAQKLEETKAQQQSAKENMDNPMAMKEKPAKKPQFFAIARDLTILGFFTSEIGATKAYEYIAIPGKYDGDYKMKPGQRLFV
ncbi:gluconate 2-dehydrogenase subunit 3 family protein [Pedobacter insulae]|uniref:Gluconate 2-dehydrogenase subunit 3 n=1 Tax=Pedobacter insulae TaxID=414048 RepID=A0A1I2TPA3_9SPHI|nr:gluconate 2-dehydrogenase subunit 3 family protein [Pedobacter insulae]SFG66738.1 Gluconate 2-dehydrogenase subunit 3 [Pedobacter insulae]